MKEDLLQGSSNGRAKLSASLTSPHWILLAAVYVSCFILLALSWTLQSDKLATASAALLTITIVTLSGVSGKEVEQTMEKIAGELGYTYLQRDSASNLSGSLAKLGNAGSRIIRNLLVTTKDGLPMRVFHYSFLIGLGTYTTSAIHYTVAELTIKEQLPHVLLITRKSSPLKAASYLPKIDGGVNIAPTGNVLSKFNCMAEDGHANLPPPIAQKIANNLDRISGMSFEFVGSKVYAFIPGQTTRKSDIVRLVDAVSIFIPSPDPRSLVESHPR